MSVRILTADRVVHGTGGHVSAPGAVVIQDDRIAWAGSQVELPDVWQLQADQWIPYSGASILPGLIDAHVHLGFGGTARPTAAIQAGSRYVVAETIRASARRLLDAGVSTARDMGAPRYVDADVDLTAGPRVLRATLPLTVPDGHCASLGGAIASDDDIVRVLSTNITRGATWCKVMGTGGFTASGQSSPLLPQFSDHRFRAIVATARDHGLPIAVHAHGTAGIRQAVAAGVNTIEHCTWLSDHDSGFDFDSGLVKDIAAQGIHVCPTINHLARRASGRLPWRVRRTHLAAMLDAGVELITGSDSGIPSTPPELFPASLGIYTDLGWTPLQILDAATGTTATALGIAHQTGTLTAGMTADLIVVRGDPTHDLSDLSDLQLVMTNGRAHPRAPTVLRRRSSHR